MTQPIPLNKGGLTNVFGASGSGEPASNWHRFMELNARARRASLVKACVAMYQYMGVLSAFGSDDNLFVQFDQRHRAGIMRFPLIPNAIDLSAAAVMSDAILFEPVTLSATTDDLVRRQAATLILDEYNTRNAVRENNIELVKHLLITGRAFKQLYLCDEMVPVTMDADVIPMYIKMKQDDMASKGFPGYQVRVDENSIRRLGDNKLRFMMNLPTIKESLVPSFNMLVETGCSTLEDCTQFAHCQYLPIRRVAELYNDVNFDFGKLVPMQVISKFVQDDAGFVNTARSAQGSGDQATEMFGTEFGLVQLISGWQLIAPHRWLNTIMVRDGSSRKPIVIHQEEKSYHPYIDYGCRHNLTYFWDDGFAYDAVDPARAYCLNMTSLQQNLQQSAKDILILDQSLQNNPVTNQFGSVLYVPSRAAQNIRRLEMPTTAFTVLQSISESMKNAVYEIVGVTEAARGIVKSHTTQGAMQLSQATANGRLGLVYMKAIRSEMVKSEKILRMASEVYDEPRYLAATNSEQSAEVLARAVRGKDLGGIYSVRVRETIEMPKTVQERMNLAMNLANSGLFESVNDFRDFVKMQSGILPTNSTEAIERDRAILENGWIADGMAEPEGYAPDGTPGPVVYVGPDQGNYGRPLTRPTDIDALHLEEHTRRYREGGLSQQQLAVLGAHIAEHNQRIAQAEQANFNQAVERLAIESQAKQSGQMVLQKMASRDNVMSAAVKALATPADGGRKSGAVRRGEPLPE